MILAQMTTRQLSNLFAASRFIALLALALLISAALACGGGNSAADSDPYEIIQFEPETPTPVVIEKAITDIALDGGILSEINYLFRHQSLVLALSQLNRDFINLSEADDRKLDWVINVHDSLTSSDRLFAYILESDPGDTLRDKYALLYLDTLRTLDLMSVGSDRLLAAAVLLGPTGRSYQDLSDEESLEFDGLIAESAYLLSVSEAAVSSLESSVSYHISAVGSP